MLHAVLLCQRRDKQLVVVQRHEPRALIGVGEDPEDAALKRPRRVVAVTKAPALHIRNASFNIRRKYPLGLIRRLVVEQEMNVGEADC
jgi:hypothetical protein